MYETINPARAEVEGIVRYNIPCIYRTAQNTQTPCRIKQWKYSRNTVLLVYVQPDDATDPPGWTVLSAVKSKKL